MILDGPGIKVSPLDARTQISIHSKDVIMIDRRSIIKAAVGSALLLAGGCGGLASTSAAFAQSDAAATTIGPSANERLTQLGPEGQALAQRVGTWDATFTSWDEPGKAPVVTGGLVAEREMIGPMLQERLHPAEGTPGPSWTRVDDLTFNRTEGRWDYMSMDSRVAAGMMSAWSLDHDPAERVFLSFLPFSTPGTGQTATGQMLRMEQFVIHQDADHEIKDQYFTAVDGVATKWLAKRYTYTRRP